MGGVGLSDGVAASKAGPLQRAQARPGAETRRGGWPRAASRLPAAPVTTRRPETRDYPMTRTGVDETARSVLPDQFGNPSRKVDARPSLELFTNLRDAVDFGPREKAFEYAAPTGAV